MKNNKLISMTDFVLEQSEEPPKGKDLHKTNWALEFEKYSKLIIRYAEFLKQPLKLEMFVPCDNEGNVLEEPKGFKTYMQDDITGAYDYFDCKKCKKYQEAKEKVLFEGLDIYHLNERISFSKNGHFFLTYSFVSNSFIGNQTPERLVGWNLTLTPSAIKQIGL